MIVISEYWDVGRVNHGVAEDAAVSGLMLPMIIVHGTVLERQVQGAGTTEVFLLGAGPAEEAATGMGGGSEVKRDDVVSLGLMPTMGGEGGLIGDLESHLVGSLLRRWVVMLRGVVTGFLQGGGHVGRDLDLASWTDVSAGFGDGDGFLAEADGKVSRNAGFELAHGRIYPIF
jgi:hypothetical protein